VRATTDIPERYAFVSETFYRARSPEQRQIERDLRSLQDVMMEIMEQSPKVREWVIRARTEFEMKRNRIRAVARKRMRRGGTR